MKLADVKLGGRYVARLARREAIVEVIALNQVPPASWSASRAWRTLIVVCEPGTDRRHTLRSAQRLRPCPGGQP